MAKQTVSNSGCGQGFIKGTGNLLQDLLSSSVSINKLTLSSLLNHKTLCSTVLEDEDKGLTCTFTSSSCSVCFSDSERVEVIKEAEVDILKEVVFKSCTNVTAPPPPGGLEFNWICTHCSAVLKRLARCRQEIKDIVTCLLSVMRIQKSTGRTSDLINSSNNGGVRGVSSPLSKFTPSSPIRDRTDAEECIALLGQVDNDKNASCILQDGDDTHAGVGSIILPAVQILPPVVASEVVSERIVQSPELAKDDDDKPTCDQFWKRFSWADSLIRHQNTKGIHKPQAQKTVVESLVDKNILKGDIKPDLLSMERDVTDDENKLRNVETGSVHGQQCPFVWTRRSITEFANIDDEKNSQYIVQTVETPMIIAGLGKFENMEAQQLEQDPLDLGNWQGIVQSPVTSVTSTLRNEATVITTDTGNNNARNNGKLKKLHLCHILGCGKVYTTTTNLQTHLRLHTGEEPFICQWPDCGKRFRKSDCLKNHHRLHTGDKSFVCRWPSCGKRFLRSNCLKIHHRLHTGEKPFVCQWPGCEKRFTMSDYLKRHNIIHTGEKRFQCLECPKKFARKNRLTSHMKTHSKSRIVANADGYQSHSFSNEDLKPVLVNMEIDMDDGSLENIDLTYLG